MSAGKRNTLLLTVGAVSIYAAAVVILLAVLPGPHTASDLLVIGSVATFVTLLALFLTLVLVWFRSPDTFFKRRRRS
jgi:hypothetical protein